MKEPWVVFDPMTLGMRACFILRDGSTLIELDRGSVVVPLDDPRTRKLVRTSLGHLYVWSFVVPDGSIVEFYLHSSFYKVCSNLLRSIEKDLRSYFSPIGRTR